MFESKLLSVKPLVAEIPVRLPLSILLALPDYVTSDVGAQLFNLPAAIGRLIGRAGYTRAMKIMSPSIWAPEWSDMALLRFATSQFHDRPEIFEDVHVASLRALSFAGASGSRRRYDIVHFIGYVAARDESVKLVLSEALGNDIGPGALRDSLVAAKTRLLILQVPQRQLELSDQLAEVVVNGGGPAVLLVAGRDAGIVDRYLLNLYANILHNVPIPQLAMPEQWMVYDRLTVQDLYMNQEDRGISARILYGPAGENLLSFDEYINELRNRANFAQVVIQTTTGRLLNLEQNRRPYLHQSQAHALVNLAETAPQLVNSIGHQSLKLNQVAWDHEREGVIPVSEIAEELAEIESERSALVNIEQAAASSAARVLNANFRDPSRQHLVKPLEGLRPGSEYELLVDVGPRWDKVPSIVKGSALFPEASLPPGQEGWPIQVVLVSNDFSPHLSSAFMWVPRGSGRSFRYLNSVKEKTSGPIALPIRTPIFASEARDIMWARGRLCLYYENNLLQSAVVRASITRNDNIILNETDPNSIDVDFVLTTSFQDLESRYATRSLEPVAETGDKGQRVILNLTLNDDGTGNHRIVIKDHPEVDPAWSLYDPMAARRTVEVARKTLQDCFYKKDKDTGTVLKRGDQPIYGLDSRNGKTKNQFLWDLYYLAKTGRDLFNKAFSGVQFGKKGMLRAEWEDVLQQTLSNGGVIQVARTGLANYAFPWALLYEYPLSGPEKDWKRCKVTEEWLDDGNRKLPSDEKQRARLLKCCPHKNEAFHRKNVLCPYGFWGLKQIIEQPLSALQHTNGNFELGDASRQVSFDDSLEFSVGLTEDLDQASGDAHLTKLAQIDPIRFNPVVPANDYYKIQAMLRAPIIVYFLCHGEYDVVQEKPFLSVGPRDNSETHKIYPDNIQHWGSPPPDLDIASWKKRKPLIFINGCHTTDIIPGEVLNFVTPFAELGASGVIGTEVNVVQPVAIEIAESLFSKMLSAEPKAVGYAMQQVRWELANKGNLLGLAYTLYCMADLRAVRNIH